MFQNIAYPEILDCIPHPVAVIDTELRLISANRFFEALTGRTNVEAAGVQLDFLLRSNLNAAGDVLTRSLVTGAMESVEGNLIDVNRKRISVRFTLSKLKDSTGAVVGQLLFVEDLAQRGGATGEPSGAGEPHGMIGHSSPMENIFNLIPVFARTDASVLITGETGTGKDMIAEAIHDASKRSNAPFIKVNCGALPENLLESELFGHVRGAFTGADRDKPGMFRLADRGTIFLTEIGDLPAPLQVKLLTVLDDRAFYPLGSSKKVKVDVRVLAATHRDLRTLVAERLFREDLLFRLNVLRLHMPSLRDREDDIVLLEEHFLRKFAEASGQTPPGIDRAAAEVLRRYPFPGNVRELRNVLEHGFTLSHGKTIRLEHLPRYIRTTPVVPEPTSRQIPASSVGPPQLETVSPGMPAWDYVERKMIVDALTKTGGRRAKAADILGWGRTTLYRKMRHFGL